MPSEVVEEVSEKMTSLAVSSSAGAESTPANLVKKLKKKLKQIEELELKIAQEGYIPSKEQEEKLSRKREVEEELRIALASTSAAS